MSRRWKAILFPVLYLTLCLLDFYFTDRGNPGGVFVNESNPLIRVFGLGWGALLFANLLGFLFYLWGSWYHYYYYQPHKIECTSFREYCGLLLYNDPHAGFFTFRLVKNRAPQLDLTAFTMLVIFPAIRLVVVAEWAVSFYFHDLYILYCSLFSRVTFQYRLFEMGIICAAVTVLYWFQMRYRENQVLLSLEETT